MKVFNRTKSHWAQPIKIFDFTNRNFRAIHERQRADTRLAAHVHIKLGPLTNYYLIALRR